MKRYFLLSLCLWAFAQSALAYPISPRPLRKLIAESKYIVMGYVVKTYKQSEKKKNKKDEYYIGYTTARIAVLECLQGRLTMDTIELNFIPNMTCPAPDRYYDSTHVLCFLNEDEDGKLYTHALSYGSKTMSPEDMAVYKMRIQEMQNISAFDNKERQFSETVEWLVKCAEHEATRWEGTFELKPESDFMSFYSRDAKEDFVSLLSPDQKQRLYRALPPDHIISYQDFALIDLAYQGNETGIDALLLRNLKSLEEDDYWLADEYFKRLRYRNLTADMRKIMQRFEDLGYDADKAKLKVIIGDFIKLVE